MATDRKRFCLLTHTTQSSHWRSFECSIRRLSTNKGECQRLWNFGLLERGCQRGFDQTKKKEILINFDFNPTSSL